MNALSPLAWSVLLMLVGCVVMVLEVFIPSGGLLAVVSAAAFVGAILFAFQQGPVTGFSFLVTTVILVPAVLAQLVILLKDTSLGYVITYPELLHSAKIIGNDYGNSFLQALIIAAFIYFILAYALSKLVVLVERRLRKKTAAPAKAVQQIEQSAVVAE